MYSYGPPHMTGQKQDDQLEHTYRSYVRDVALKTCQRRWTIGRSGKRGSGISVLAARHDDDDYFQNPKKIFIKTFCNIFNYLFSKNILKIFCKTIFKKCWYLSKKKKTKRNFEPKINQCCLLFRFYFFIFLFF